MAGVLRFLTSFFEEDTLKPGLFEKADGTVWVRLPDGTETQLPGSGGGGFVPARNVGQASFTFAEDVAANAAANMTLSLDSGDPTLVDLTSPANPKIVTPGVYAFTLALVNTLGSASGWQAGLYVDDNYYSLTALNSRLGSADDGFNTMPGCVVWWCDASDRFLVQAQVGPGADSDHFAGTLYLQRIT